MKTLIVALALAILVPAAALSQTMKHDQMMHEKQTSMITDDTLPQETGQPTFAAVQEIVAMLEANPATDWSRVDIEALRQHLIDMNNVTLGTVVTANEKGAACALQSWAMDKSRPRSGVCYWVTPQP